MEKSKGSLGGDRYRDASFGMAHFSRISGSQKLFGSEIEHQHFIALTISRGSVERELSKDWFLADGGPPIVEVFMSNTQFADLITSMGMGSGVPVTIRQIENESFRMPDFPDKGEQFREELKNHHQELLADYKDLEETTNELLSRDKPLNKKEKEALKENVSALAKFAKHSLPYLADSFQEQMEKSVSEAKAEVEAFISTKVVALGLESLEQLVKLGQIEKQEK